MWFLFFFCNLVFQIKNPPVTQPLPGLRNSPARSAGASPWEKAWLRRHMDIQENGSPSKHWPLSRRLQTLSPPGLQGGFSGIDWALGDLWAPGWMPSHMLCASHASPGWMAWMPWHVWHGMPTLSAKPFPLQLPPHPLLTTPFRCVKSDGFGLGFRRSLLLAV